MDRLRNLRRVLLVSKRTRWEFASIKFGGSSGAELENYLRSRGFPYERIRAAHDSHHDALGRITRAMTRRGCDVRLVRAPALIASDLEDVDCVLTAGGDGTVLETAARIKTSRLPVISINTDPTLSHGHLCAFKLGRDASFDQGVLNKLRQGRFQPLLRSRIQVKFTSRSELSPLLALNEIFYAERDASRPTVHETRLPSCFPDGVVQRSSGVIVSTGTGSTAWMSSASMVHRSDVQRVYDAVKRLKGDAMQCDLSSEELDRVSEMVNKESLFSPSSKQLQYCIRELVLNGWNGSHDMPLSHHPRHGFDESMSITSRAWDGVLTFDGIESVDVPYGETLEMCIAPESRALMTVQFKEDD